MFAIEPFKTYTFQTEEGEIKYFLLQYEYYGWLKNSFTNIR
jgi:hypothetical protein